MVHDEAKLIVQSSSTAYTFVKDMFLYMKGTAKYIRDLEDNLTNLTVLIITLYSRKKQIDRNLEMAISKEKNAEYDTVVMLNEIFLNKYKKFMDKYGKYCKNLSNLTQQPEALQLDVSNARSVIRVVQARKPTILTRNFFRLAKLSKDIKKLGDQISKVTDKMKKDNLLIEKEPEQVQVKDVDIDIPSFNNYVDQVVSYLYKDDIRSIGIVGLIGVGKTTVMKKLNNKLKDPMSSKAEIVIWIDYPDQSQGRIVETMQDMIIGRLKLNTGAANDSDKADIISKALCERKYILLIDQVSSAIDLDKVGIRKDHKFGKVVVASNSFKYINQMAKKHVKIMPLLKEDASILFRSVYGEIPTRRIQDIADQIIASCGGLPLVIKLVATYLIGVKDEEVWSYVKSILKSEIEEGQLLKLGGVINAYKLVYDGMEWSYMKSCLLFGALYPDDHKIYRDYLVECWMAEGFLESSNTLEHDRRLRRARDHGATVLKELTDRYLLERCSDKCVKMPVYFRKVVLAQQYPSDKSCVISGPENSEKSKFLNEIWSEARRMSLICCNPELPKCPSCGNMSTLLLQRNQKLIIGVEFFKNMQNLRILDLCETRIESLPSSISSLSNLVSLYLNDCPNLAKLPLEEKMLEKLEVLDIRGTSICKLPNQIDIMCNLRCLRVSLGQKGCNYGNTREKKVEVIIPPKIISLKQLEELVIEMGCCNQGWNSIVDQIVDEVATLEKLTTLFIHFPSVYTLEKFVTSSISWKNTETSWGKNTFRSFNFSIGCSKRRHPYASNVPGVLAERQLRFSTTEQITEEISSANQAISSVDEVLRQASTFELVGNSLVESLSEFDLANAGALKVCIVERCENLKWIVGDAENKTSTTAGAILECLEMLHLIDLNLLESISNASVLPESFTRLKVLTLSGCPALTHIFNLELAKLLSSLQHIKVEHCSEIGEIIKIDASKKNEHADPADTLPKLETIELVNLPKLQSICASTSKKWRSLRKIVVTRCRELKKLHLSNMDKLERIQCEYSWWTALQESIQVKQRFLQYCDFIETESGGENHEGESSSNGESVNLGQAIENIDSQICNGEDRVEQVKPGNRNSISLSTSNIYVQEESAAEECLLRKKGKMKVQ